MRQLAPATSVAATGRAERAAFAMREDATASYDESLDQSEGRFWLAAADKHHYLPSVGIRWIGPCEKYTRPDPIARIFPRNPCKICMPADSLASD